MTEVYQPSGMRDVDAMALEFRELLEHTAALSKADRRTAEGIMSALLRDYLNQSKRNQAMIYRGFKIEPDYEAETGPTFVISEGGIEIHRTYTAEQAQNWIDKVKRERFKKGQ